MSELENTQEHDVDAIIAHAYGQAEQPVSESSQQPPAAVQQEPSQPSFKEYEFNARGQAIKIRDDDPRLQKWLSQGYDYSQNINSFKTERESWEKNRQDWESKWGKYKEIDQFAAQNPDWWSQIEQSYQTRLQPQISPELKNYLDPIVKDYGMVKEFVQKYQEEQIQKQIKEQDSALESEIKSIQKELPDLDFNSKDESGLSLEQRVLNHAIANGIPTFKSAFRDYAHDLLLKRAEAKAKESVMADMKQKKKLGLLGESSTPSKGVSMLDSGRGKSWNDVHTEALRELNIM